MKDKTSDDIKYENEKESLTFKPEFISKYIHTKNLREFPKNRDIFISRLREANDERIRKLNLTSRFPLNEDYDSSNNSRKIRINVNCQKNINQKDENTLASNY